jgi:hypothetical protein
MGWVPKLERKETTSDFTQFISHLSDYCSLSVCSQITSTITLWCAHCRSTVNSGNACLQLLLSNATMEGSVVYFGVCSGDDIMQQ